VLRKIPNDEEERSVTHNGFGPYILGAVALGLAAYGVFMFVVARYRRIEPA
jgi:hypothetical protein